MRRPVLLQTTVTRFATLDGYAAFIHHRMPIATATARTDAQTRPSFVARGASRSRTPQTFLVSVVIPALNEARNLPHVLPGIPEWVDEIVLVDGQSTDDTVAVAKRTCPGIRVVHQPGKGKGDALRAGFQAARGDIVVMLDADGSMRPGEIDSYIAWLLLGYDMVKGSRFMQGGDSTDITPIRRLGNRALVSLVRFMFGGSYSDLCYGYGGFWKSALRSLRLEDEPDHLGFEIETLIAVRALAQKLKVAEVPSIEAERIHGTSRLNAARDGWRVLKTIVREWRSRARRLRSRPEPVFDRALAASDIDVSVVVCCFDLARWDQLVEAIESLQAQDVPPRQIIVVVDHNRELFERARAFFEGVLVRQNEHPRGISGARNTGIRAATGTVVAFLDDDAVAAPDWIACLAASYRRPGVIGVGGTIEPRFPTERPRWLPPEFDWVVGCTYRGLPETSARVRNLIGCNMSFHRDAFAIAGGFSDFAGRVGAIGIGCDDTEFSIRVGRYFPRHHLLFEPAARVVHQLTDVRTRWWFFVRRCVIEGRSKAMLRDVANKDDALSSERAYVRRTIPAALLRELRACGRGDFTGLLRMIALVVGVGAAACGYALGRVRYRRGSVPMPTTVGVPESRDDRVAVGEPLWSMTYGEPSG